MATLNNPNESGQQELESPPSSSPSSKGLTLGALVSIGTTAFLIVGLITYGITHFEKNTNSQERQINQTNVTTPESGTPRATCWVVASENIAIGVFPSYTMACQSIELTYSGCKIIDSSSNHARYIHENVIITVVGVQPSIKVEKLTRDSEFVEPKIEQVEVIVAAKDLAVGTLMSKNDIPKLIVKKKVPKDSLPTLFVVDESELLDKRLSAPVLADQTFNPSALSTRGVITLPEGKDMISLPVSVANAAAGFIGPGSKVDVLATMKTANKLYAFPLLVDMQVLAVDTHTTYDTKTGIFPNMSMVSLAVTQEQALVLQLAKQRDCHIELLLRHPNKSLDAKYDMARVKQLLTEDAK